MNIRGHMQFLMMKRVSLLLHQIASIMALFSVEYNQLGKERGVLQWELSVNLKLLPERQKIFW